MVKHYMMSVHLLLILLHDTVNYELRKSGITKTTSSWSENLSGHTRRLLPWYTHLDVR